MVFADLKFSTHKYIKNAVYAKHTFLNGMTISIAGGENGLYGNGKTNFEVVAWFSDGTYWKLCEKGWAKPEDITQMMEFIDKINPQKEYLKQQLKESVTEIENFEQEIHFHKQRIAEIEEKLKEM